MKKTLPLVMMFCGLVSGLLASPAAADMNSYMNCILLSRQHLSPEPPQAKQLVYNTIGQEVSRNIRNNGSSSMAEISRLEGNGIDPQLAQMIVQCASVNGPI
ncbi:hypothetical protein [Mycobacterium sp. 1245852.3]|uniref:hypothetical protein n=1 Tax=Mycobacterium sp. 1245852.3 TaxID=1856860 RepID=UPI000B1295A0|nr:hypothetical protein [Mycobacterium sp. 1245852.3]